VQDRTLAFIKQPVQREIGSFVHMCRSFGCLRRDGFDPGDQIGQVFRLSDHFILMAIPFFILVGSVMNRGGIAMRRINFAKFLAGGCRDRWPITTSLPT